MKKYQMIREIIMGVMRDGKTHTAEELHRTCEQNGVEIRKNRSEIYNTVHQLKKKGFIQSDGENGYLLVDREKDKILVPQEHVSERQEQILEECVLGKVDLSDFEIVKPAIRKEARQVISVLDNGDLVFNSTLIKKIKTNQIEIRIKKDCSQILLVPNGTVLLDITKNGRIKNYQIYEKLKGKKMKFPVYYVGEWEEKHNIWIGELVMTNPNKTIGKTTK